MKESGEELKRRFIRDLGMMKSGIKTILTNASFCPNAKTARWDRIVLHSARTVLYSKVQYSTVQYSTVQHNIVQHITVQCSAIQYSTALYITSIHITSDHITSMFSTVQYLVLSVHRQPRSVYDHQACSGEGLSPQGHLDADSGLVTWWEGSTYKGVGIMVYVRDSWYYDVCTG